VYGNTYEASNITAASMRSQSLYISDTWNTWELLAKGTLLLKR
jgi:hypothetical protein